MTLGERIKELRKKKLNKTLEQFGERIKLGKSALSAIENNQRGVTDQTVLTICREFSVSEAWLRTGEGEPFRAVQKNQLIQSFIDSILKDEPEGPKARLVSALAGLDEHGWDVLVELAQKMVSENAGGKTEERAKAAPSAAEPSPSGLSPDEQELIRQYRERKNQEGRSSASAAS